MKATQPMIEKLTRYRNRAMTSFIVDDFCGATPEDGMAYREFSQWMETAGVKGEISAILGMKRSAEGRALPVDPAYAAEISRSAGQHLDAFMEVMTHWGIYDFALDRIRPEGPHECVWLNQRNRPLDEYLDYFGNIAKRAQAAGFKFSGLTQPGCACQQCLSFFYGSHLTWEANELNPMVSRALIELAREGQLAGPVIGMFIGWCETGPTDTYMVMEEGQYAVYDLPPGIKDDFFARESGDSAPPNIDPLITADGCGGRLPEMLALGTQTMLYFSHWHNVGPQNPLGFQAFQQVAARLQDTCAERIVWMRPSEIAGYRHTERHTQVWPEPGGFRLSIPFAPLHALSFRLPGTVDAKLISPSGTEILPSAVSNSDALYELWPENGQYRIV